MTARNDDAANVIYSLVYRYDTVSVGKHSWVKRRKEGHVRHWPQVAGCGMIWPACDALTTKHPLPIAVYQHRPHIFPTFRLAFPYPGGKQTVKNG